jgi:hypothetical protein
MKSVLMIVLAVIHGTAACLFLKMIGIDIYEGRNWIVYLSLLVAMNSGLAMLILMENRNG